MNELSEAALNALEFDAARTGEHGTAADLMSTLAEAWHPDSDVSSAEALVRAGEQWEMAEEPGKAIELYRRAIADGGTTWLDPRAYLAAALLRLGRDREARGLIDELRADHPDDPRLYQWIAEALFDTGDITGAQGWATEGAQCWLRAGGDEHAVDLQVLLRIRYRARVDLGLPEDDLDGLVDLTPST